MIKRDPVSEVIHETLLKTFYNYIVVGGMPEVVQTFVDPNDLSRCIELPNNIVHLYRSDIAQYAKNNRFKLAQISKNARYTYFESGFLWLAEAGVALPCYNCSAPVLPLDLNLKRNLFKLYLCDTGLLCAMSMKDLQFDLLQGNVHINHGSILENVFAQELISKNISLVYYDQKKLGELDFVVQDRDQIHIFEIKSGNDFQKHAALSKAAAKKE